MGKKSRVKRQKHEKHAITETVKTSNKNVLLAVIILSVVLSGGLIYFISGQTSSDFTKEQHLTGIQGVAQDEEVVARFLSGMENWLKKVQNPKATELYHFFRQNYTVTKLGDFDPQKQGYRINWYKNGNLLRGRPTIPLGVLIVRPADVTPEKEKYLSKNVLDRTFYDQATKSFWLSQKIIDSRSEQAMALTMFHETFHAYQHFQKKYVENRGYDDMYENERQAYLFETELLGQYLGPAYYRLLMQMVKEIQVYYVEAAEGGVDITINPKTIKLTHINDLKNILWTTKSQEELEMIFLFMEIHAMFKVAEIQTKSSGEENLRRTQIGIMRYIRPSK